MDGLEPLTQASQHCFVSQGNQENHAELSMDGFYNHRDSYDDQLHEQQHSTNMQYASNIQNNLNPSSVLTNEQQELQNHTTYQVDHISPNSQDGCPFPQSIHYQHDENRLDDGLESRMTDDDAFMAFCGDPSLLLDNDANARYYTNKLYQPLTNCSNNQNYSHNANSQSESDSNFMDTGDEYSLYQDLKFIDPSGQKTLVREEVSELAKILEDDGGDENTNLGKDEDPLDCLQLTNIIESFDDFASSPMIDSGNGSESSILSAHSNVSRTDQQVLDADLGNRLALNSQNDIQEINYNQVVDYNSYTNAHQNHITQSNRTLIGQSVKIENQSNNIMTCDSIFQSQKHDHHQENGSDTNNRVYPSADLEHEITSTNEEQTPKKIENRKRSTDDDMLLTSRTQNKRFKKKRSTMSVAEKKRAIADQLTNQDLNIHNQELHINELTTHLQNDEDELLVSDNNSMRSDCSRRNPVVNQYRRRTANARERIRMREINQAFEKLKKVVPIELVQQAALESGEMSDQATQSSSGRKKSPSSTSGQQQDSVKLTKITTLRLAVSYIAKLTEMLNQSPESSASSNDRPAASPVQISTSSNQRTRDHPTEEPTKRTRRSRSTSKPSIKERGRKKSSESDNTKVEIPATPIQEVEEPVRLGEFDQVENQNQLIVYEKPRQEQITSYQISNQQPQPATFISIPSQQKQQYLTTYPYQQQILIRQPCLYVMVCILADQYQSNGQYSNKMKPSNDLRNQHEDQQQQVSTTNDSIQDERVQNDRIQTPRDKMEYVTHFTAQPDQNVANSGNITQLVTSLATSIQPPNNNTVQTAVTSPSKQAPGENNPQHTTQQQPVRIYRFHNYDGNMINKV